MMFFHGPKSLKGLIISYCDAKLNVFGQADDEAPWHNRSYLLNGKLSEAQTVVVKWEKFADLPHQNEEDEFLSEQQGTYRIGLYG